MTPTADHPTRVVGRCIVCGDLIVETVRATVVAGMSIAIDTAVVRQCGCGTFAPLDREGESG